MLVVEPGDGPRLWADGADNLHGIMRITATVSAVGKAIPARDAHTGARPALYGLLKRVSPDAATLIHEHGWQGSGRKPWSVRPPVEALVAGSVGELVIATPIEELAEMFVTGLSLGRTLHWGTTDLTIEAVVSAASPLVEGLTEWTAITPTVVRGNDDRPLLPNEGGWAEALRHYVVRAAQWLRVEVPDVKAVSGSGRVIVPVDGRNRACTRRASVLVEGAPVAISAIADLGLGWRCTEGFGFIEAAAQTTTRRPTGKRGRR